MLHAETPEERDRNCIATGFLALAAKPAKAMNNNFDMDVVADQIDVIGSGVMGLSVACARCHDHKFDPVTTQDYYALAGIFTSSETMWGLAANERLTAPKTDLHVLEAATLELVESLTPVAESLHCKDELLSIREMMEVGCSSDRQRRAMGDSDDFAALIRELARELIEDDVLTSF